jgi:hypothetical protein
MDITTIEPATMRVIDMQMLSERPLSYSSLKEFRKSPKHYVRYLDKRRETTEAMMIGNVVECLSLEPEKFDLKFMVFDKIPLTSKENKEKYQALVTQAKENRLTLVTRETHETAKKCVQSLFDHDIARKIIEARKRVQLKMRWMHKETGLPMTGVIDFESRAWESDFIIDLKTAKSADPDQFIRDAANLDYHIQCGSYLDGYPRTQFKFPSMAFVVVENDEPFNVSVMFCENQYTERALDEYHGTVRAFRYCLDNQLFHMGYDFRLMGTKDYFGMSLPGYMKEKFT